MRFISLFAFLLASSAFAFNVAYVYPVASVKKLEDGTMAFTTPKNLSVYVSCTRMTFDDSTHDKVSGFSSKRECDYFVEQASIPGAEIVLDGMSLSIRIVR